MHVELNDEAEYAGGRLVFETSSGFEMPRRPAGTACTHTFDVVHGVTAMESGTRYSLFFCNTEGDAPYPRRDARNVASLEEVQKLQYLVVPTLAQFQYFEAAILLLRRTSDKQLAAAVVEYACFLAAHVRHDAGQVAPPQWPLGPAVELAWRVHKLRPITYLAACERLQSSLLHDPHEVLGVDLVAAIRRQVDALEPSALVDLVWHTHQQMADRFHKDCMRIAGRLVDHDDTPERTCISVGG